MNIRQKILIYFTMGSIPLFGLAFIFILAFFNDHRREEFHQQQIERISTTLQLLGEIKREDEELRQALDRLTIYDLYDEKLLIFNDEQILIYSSTEDIPSPDASSILPNLTPGRPWIRTRENDYDVVGMLWQSNNQHYYAISKAYDAAGYSKLSFLRYALTASFLFISGLIVLIAWLLSRKISNPIIQITSQIGRYDFGSDFSPISVDESKGEIAFLARQFNLLLKRMTDAFAFQKHAIHHISHELKTPIAILVSNFEKMERETNLDVLQNLLANQKQDTKNLADILNALLEISKAEQHQTKRAVRVDELLFDTLDEMQILNSGFHFETALQDSIENESSLTVYGNERLLKLALVNLINNCVQYSSSGQANIDIKTGTDHVTLQFTNPGQTIREEEKQYLFRHFFRGENSKGKRGFGLGLVLVNKVAHIHKGSISYDGPGKSTNIFSFRLPLN